MSLNSAYLMTRNFIILWLTLWLVSPVWAVSYVQKWQSGLGGVMGLDGANDAALSHDGKFLYAVGFGSNSLAVFARNATDGKLTFVRFYQDGVAGIDGLGGAYDIAVSPDDKQVYVTGYRDNSVSSFVRNPVDGTLTYLEMHKNDVVLKGASGVAMSTDGARVYVSSSTGNALSAFSRDPATGIMIYLGTQTHGVNGVTALAGPGMIAVSKDAQFIYVAAESSHAVAIFQRAPQVGEIGFVGAYTGAGASGAYGVAVSPDNQRLYVTSSSSHTLAALARDPNTGALTHLASYQDGVNSVSGIRGAWGVAISPDNGRVYVTGNISSALAVFDVYANPSTTGGLLWTQAIKSTDATDQPLNGASAVAISPDSGHIYATAFTGNAVSLFSNFAADLQVAMSDASDPVEVNSEFQQQIIITNLGPSASGPVALTYTLPVGAQLQTTPAGCVAQGGQLSCANLAELSPGQQHSLAIRLKAPASAAKVSATAQVSAVRPDPTAANNTATESTVIQSVVAKADIAVQLTANANPANVGTPLTYTLTVQNSGPAAATGVTAELSGLHSAITNVQAETPCVYAATNNKVTCALGNIAAGNAISRTVTVTTPTTPATLSAQLLTTMAEQDPNPQTPASTALTIPVQVLTLDIAVAAQTAVPATQAVGQPVSFVTQIMNHGPYAAPSVTLANTLPAGMEYASHAFSAGISADPTKSCTRDANVLTCQLGTLDAFAQSQTTYAVTVTGTALIPGDLKNTVKIATAATDSDQTNDQSQATATITGAAADLALVITSDTPSVLKDGTVTFTNTVSNAGPSNATGLTISHAAQGGSVVEVVADPGWVCGTGPAFSCTRASLGASASSAIQVKMLATELGTVTLSATGTVDAGLYDRNTPNAASKSVAVSTIATDLELTATATPAALLTGAEAVFSVTVTNKGTQGATGAVVSYPLPANVAYKQAIAGQGQCTLQNNTVTCALQNIPASASTGASITVIPSQPGTFTNPFTLTSTSFDPNATNNQASATLTVTKASADLALTVTDNQDPVAVGNEVVYLAQIKNKGPNSATQTRLVHILPAEASYISATPSQGTCQQANNTITCELGSIAKDGEASVMVTVLAKQPGTLLHSVSVKANEADADAPSGETKISVETRVTEPQRLMFIHAYRNGESGALGLSGASALAMSADERHVYAAGFNDNALTVFQRNATTGALTFVQALNKTGGVDGLNKPSSVTVSDDGAQVYVTGYGGGGGLVVLRRDAGTGRLEFQQWLQDGQSGVDGLGAPFDVITRGNTVYVAATSDHAISQFQRDNSGLLALTQTYRNGANGIQGLEGVTALTLSADGSQLYAAAMGANALTVFSRDNQGNLAQTQVFKDGVNGVTGLTGAAAVVVAPDNKFIYVAGSTANAVAIFSQDSAGVAYQQTVSNQTGLGGVTGLALSPDGNTLYTAASQDGALGIFTRAAGKLTFSTFVRDGENSVDGLAGAQDVIVSKNGGSLYVAGLVDSAVAAFRAATADLNITVSADKTQATVNETVTLVFTVRNTGPDQANGVTWINTLPQYTQLLSATPSKGSPCAQAANTVSCNLGLLDAGQSAQVTLKLAPQQHGEINNAATITANQYEPTPADNSTTTLVHVVGNADLSLTLRQETAAPVLGDELRLTATLLNNGPNPANQARLTLTLPADVHFMQGQIAGVDCVETAGVVTCQATQALANQQNQTASLMLEPRVIGAVTVRVSASAAENDAQPANNTAQVTATVAGNVITQNLTNTGTLKNREIAQDVIVTGGSVAGVIINHGLLQNVTVLSGATITGGGRLAGEINNQGVIDSAILNGAVKINGGVVKGVIAGDANAGAVISAHIAAGATLSHVEIGSQATVDSTVIIGAGVKFQQNANIPPGLNLTGAYASLTDPVTGVAQLALHSDVLKNGPTLLEQINRIPGLAQAGLTIAQSAQNLLTATYQNLLFSVIPITVTQTSADPGVTLNSDGSVLFVTETRRAVLAQPAAHRLNKLRELLQSLGITSIDAVADSGNYSIAVSPQIRWVFRADPTAAPAPAGMPALSDSAAPLANRRHVIWTVADSDTCASTVCAHSQTLYPASPAPASLLAVLRAIPGARNVQLHYNGTVSLTVGVTQYRGLLEYEIMAGTNPGGVTQMLDAADRNSDGEEDFWIVYPNGDRQGLLLFPPEDLLQELQAIPAVRQLGLQITAATEPGALYISQGVAQRSLQQPVAEDIVPASAEPTLQPRADGGMIFTLSSGRRIHTQPLPQELAQLTAILTPSGLQLNTQGAEQGNWLLPLVPGLQYSLRPAIYSTPSSAILGLYAEKISSGEGLYFKHVFQDAQGVTRQQYLYPAPLLANQVVTFFDNLTQGGQVELANDGRIRLQGGGIDLNGQLGYSVTSGATANGGLALTSINDRNGDGRNDYQLTYPDGRTQLIYAQ